MRWLKIPKNQNEKQIQKSASIHNESETFIVHSDCMAYYKWLVLYFAWGRNLFRYWLDDYGCGCIYRFSMASNLPEKIVTFAIALVLLRLLFPNDQKTLAVLENLYEKAKMAFKSKKKTGKASTVTEEAESR